MAWASFESCARNRKILPHFVLVTAFDHYAIEAFRMEAFDYLLKPVEKARLDETIQRAHRLFGEHRAAEPIPLPIPIRRSSAPRFS